MPKEPLYLVLSVSLFAILLTLAPLISFLQMEIDNGDELTADYMYEEVHPKQHAHKQAFAKPKGPNGKRGGRRITRPPGHGDADD